MRPLVLRQGRNLRRRHRPTCAWWPSGSETCASWPTLSPISFCFELICAIRAHRHPRHKKNSAVRAKNFHCEPSCGSASLCSTFTAMVKTQEMSVLITLLLQVRSVSVRITTWTLGGPAPPLTPVQHSARVLIWAILTLLYATSEGHIPTAASQNLATCLLPCFTVFLLRLLPCLECAPTLRDQVVWLR